MAKKQIMLAGMRHHDFEPEIPEIYERVIGERVMLSKEDDNIWDKGKAVAAYYEGNLLAYVSGDQNKLIVRNLIQLTGREPYPCVVKKFRPKKNDNGSDVLLADVQLVDGQDMCICLKTETESTNWENWCWKAGPMLPKLKEQNQLQAVTSDLWWLLKDRTPWCKYYEDNLRAISETAWADISGDQQEKVREIVSELTLVDDERMAEAAYDLQQVMIHLGSPEARQKVFNNLKVQAEDTKVIAKVKELGYTTESLIETFPPGMYQLLTGDPETFVGTTSYLKMPSDVLQSMFSGVIYLLCCFMLEAKERMASALPLEERVISVKTLLDIADQCKGSDLAMQLCHIILLSTPNLSQEDLNSIRSKMRQEPVMGQTFKECTFTGNNIIESIQNASRMPALPKAPDVQLIEEKKDEI